MEYFDQFFVKSFQVVEHTAVSMKVVSQKCKSVRDNADWYYG